MSHPFGNDRFRFGSAAFANHEDIKQAGLLTRKQDSLFVGFHQGKPLWYNGDGGILKVGGARAGKLRDMLAFNVCSGVLANSTLLILDVKGELAAISQDQTPDGKHCLYWNPQGLHGLPQHRINPFGHLRWSSLTVFSDVKLTFAGLLPSSGAGNARYFELNARRIGEALALTLIKSNGVLTFPDLFDAVQMLLEGGPRWIDFAYEMHISGMATCRAVEAEIHAAREDSSGGFKGIIGELLQALSVLSDPALREALSPPYDGTLEDLCRSDQAYQFYMMCPPEMIESWAPVIKAFLTSAKVLKSRAPQAPKQTWIIDEAARLTGYEEIAQLYTDGAGIGIRPFAIFQDVSQMNDLAPNAARKITSSAALRIYFGVRDLTSARQVSDMLGSETLGFDDPLHQGRAEVKYRDLLRAVFSGADPFRAVLEIVQKRYETVHLSKQQRKLRTPEEVMALPGDRHIIFGDGLPGPIYAERCPYWTVPWMAGRYHPNPFHPPLDKVRVQTLFGARWRLVVTAPVPERFAHYPQYQGGQWSYIGG